MRDYELMVVVSPRVTEEGLPNALARVNEAISTNGGLVQETFTNPPWGHRRLAYPIQDFRDAYYAVFNVQIEPGRIDTLERDLRLQDQLIRYLIVRRDDQMRAEGKAAVRRANAAAAAAAAEDIEEDGDGGTGTE